jgi:hypothetical protein
LKTLEIPINVFYKRINGGNTLQQHFLFVGPKKNYKYLLDQRFIHYTYFWKKMKKCSLVEEYPGIEFSRVETLEDRTISVYNINKANKSDLKEIMETNFIFVVSGEIPDNPGCEFCKFKELIKSKEVDFIRCSYLNKTFIKARKSCKWFMQKEILNR